MASYVTSHNVPVDIKEKPVSEKVFRTWLTPIHLPSQNNNNYWSLVWAIKIVNHFNTVPVTNSSRSNNFISLQYIENSFVSARNDCFKSIIFSSQEEFTWRFLITFHPGMKFYPTAEDQSED